jgi:mannose-1-phosphate guanylyltransferase/mannose-6-phosphate isomerase
MPATIPVILSGGAGTRLWPISRRLAPKQLQRLTGERSMLEDTLARISHLDGEAMVVANVEQLGAIEGQVPPGTRLVGEPVARNTAPAAAAAALLSDPEDVLVVLPSDHHIADTKTFRAALESAIGGARSGHLVAFGVVPDRPETGYGYIVPGPPASSGRLIERFVEKPDLQAALGLIESGALWNGGMFAFQARVLVDEMARHAPAVLEAVSKSVASAKSQGSRLLLGEEFGQAPSLSVDVAVMEKTDLGLVVELDAGWSDAGSWESLYALGQSDSSGNVILGDVVTEDVKSSYLRSDGPLVAVLGVDNLVIVATGDAVLVTKRDRVQEVKRLVERLEGRSELSIPPPSSSDR